MVFLSRHHFFVAPTSNHLWSNMVLFDKTKLSSRSLVFFQVHLFQMSFYKCNATSCDDIEHNLYIDLNCAKVEGPNTLEIHRDGADGICIKCVTALKVTSVVCPH